MHRNNMFAAAHETQSWFRPVDPEEFWAKAHVVITDTGLEGVVHSVFSTLAGESMCVVESKGGLISVNKLDSVTFKDKRIR